MSSADSGTATAKRETRIRRSARRRRMWRTARPYLYVLPAFAGVAVWVYAPIVRTMRLSTVQWNLLPTTPQRPVGLANYRDVIAMPEMRAAVRNTVWYAIGLLPFSIVLPLAVAVVLDELTGRIRATYRALIFLPMLMAPVVVAVIWRWILHPTQGVLAAWLQPLGIASPNWLRDDALALWTITGIAGWKLVGFASLIFAAGLANIDTRLRDAARVDGANRWQEFRYITLPLLSPTIMFMVLLTVLLSAQWTFPLVNVLTQGGPLDSTTNVYYLLWKYGFRNFNVGVSSAAAMLFFVAFGAIAIVCTRLVDRFSFHDT